MSDVDYPIDRFLLFVKAAHQRDDRKTLAELRRGLSSTTRQSAWQYIVPYCKGFDDPVTRTIWCTIAGLAALLMPDHLNTAERHHNLGATMRLICGEKGQEGLKTFEPLFRRLLSHSSVDGLCEHVARIGRTASVKGVHMNLVRLFWDLCSWNDPDKRESVRVKWAQQFFGAKPDTTEEEVAAE